MSPERRRVSVRGHRFDPQCPPVQTEQQCGFRLAGGKGTNYLNYQKGSRYTYEYTTVVHTFLQGNSHESSGLTVKCLVNIDVLDKCHLILMLRQTQIKGSMSNKEELVPGYEKLRAALEKHPLHFSFQDGIIPEICPAEGEETWSLNIKRGILSVFQDSYTVNKKETVEEVDILGKCPSTYKVQGSLLVKSKDLNCCSLRGMAVTSLQSVVLPDPTSHQQILDSQLECVQSYKDGVIEVTTCSESNVFRPFSKEGKGAKTEIFTTLKLLKKEEVTSMPRAVDLKPFRLSTLLFERESEQGKREQYASAERVAEAVRQLCLAKGMTLESADLFMSLVFDLRRLSIDDLRDLWQRALFKCRDDWQPLVDTLPACGTEACISFLTEIILSKELDKDRTDTFLWSLAFIPEPTASMVATITALMESPDASRQTFLGTSSLLHNFCSKNRRCQAVPEVQEFMKILESYVQGNCKARESEKREKVLMSLKAIGNAGLAAGALIPTLNKCVQSKTNPLQVRLASIYAFRRIPCEADRSVLVQLYRTVDEDVELRIAAYYTLMKCPSDQLFEIVGLTLRKERSSQVGSFVWTHLSQLMETNDPLKQQLRESLPNYIISKDFDLEHWKYSSYTDATFLSEPFSVGANTEAALVFSPKSFLPRSAMANLTTFAMGYAVNLLEVGIRVENAEYLAQKIFGHKQPPFMDGPKHVKNSGRKWRKKSSAKFSVQPLNKKGAVPRHTVSRSEAAKHQMEKLKPRRIKKSCQNVDYNRINEIETKFTKRMEKRKKKLSCGLSMKIFGNEMSFFDCSDLRMQIKQYSLDMAEIAIRLLKGQEVQFNRRTSLATEEMTFSSISGLPIKLAVNASAAINIRIRGNVDLKQWTDFVITGFIKPSAHIHVSAHMGLDGTIGKAGLEWVAGMRTLTSLDGGIQMKKGKDLKVFLNTPQETMEIIDISSRLYTANPGGKEEIIGSLDRTEARTCSEEEFSRQIGWQICSEMSYPTGTTGPAFPLSGPAEASVMLIKRDKGLQQYLLEAAYSYVTQKNTWFPAEAVLHFFMGTPQSDVKRDIAIDFQLNYSKRKLSAKIVHPKKMIKIVGEITKIKHTRSGKLEVLIDDRDLYYVKGWTNLQNLDGEQMFFSQLEAKFTKHGSPIILSGNVTRVPGQKIAFLISLNNVMKETATVSVHLEQRLDEKQKQYTIEADTYLPRILGCQIIGFLQQRGTTWSSTLRARYGLFGDALNLQHECNMAEKIKREANPMETYKLQVQHEFHCTQITSYNHKLHLQHEENESRTHTQLEINYGRHWDEINNKKKIFITQVFKNDSSLSLTNYFMEFTLQIPEKQINYKTQLQHSHLLQGYAESNTQAKVLYNDKIPFQAGLQWKDTSKPNLRKWEGSLKLDTPWLYLHTSHKLNQPHVRAYQSSVEITAAKAISVKNLVIYTYYKNKGNKREGRIHIHTPSTTYLKASTVGYITESLFRSHSEVVTLWNLPVKNKILLESKEKLKTFWFWIKHQKKMLNFTASYVSREESKKRKILSVVALWTTSKGPPLLMQLIGQTEELKREKMLFQNRASIQFRHPFKLSIPQNTLLQETFTVDKRKMHYALEVKALVNEKEETVHTLTLGYQPEKPFVCVGLTHPYSGEVIPKNMEVCVKTKTDHVATFEAEATMKINKRDALTFHGQYQNKSTDTDFWYLVHFDTDHSLQLRVPHTLILDGELFMMQSKNESFNYGANCKFAINKLDTSQFSVQMNGSSNEIRVYSEFSHPYRSAVPYTFQAYATAKNYDETNYNGTFYLHSNGKDLMVTEFDVVNENKRNIGILGIKAALHQSLLAGPVNSQFQITVETYKSRFLLVSSLQFDEKAIEVDVMGLKEYQEGLLMSLTGTVQHNMINGLKIPQFLHMDAVLKQQNNTNKGDLKIKIGGILYRLHLQNINTFSSTAAHELILTLTQNGSTTIPAMIEFKGQLELGQESRLGQACWQTDDRTICFQLLQVTKANQTKVTGKVTHNLEELITTVWRNWKNLVSHSHPLAATTIRI
ncbi:apolipophorins-like [Pristis pectinata]|uniref:apolipophorins-like n=1 Tax=Pristis pectinata TaxID=685728 RepID=UPI00223DAE46|nr:apolipophorins-like [Pristis pectinata]